MNHFYFAYGSNMNPDRIRRRLPDARLVGTATIKGWRLVERLYADIERSQGGRVEGVLYLLTPSELHRLDSDEGYPQTYRSVEVEAHLDANHKVKALTYTMTAATKKEREGKPYPRDYRLLCSFGARYHGVRDAFRRAGDPPNRWLADEAAEATRAAVAPQAKASDGAVACQKVGGIFGDPEAVEK